jgi:hypothetical protein
MSPNQVVDRRQMWEDEAPAGWTKQGTVVLEEDALRVSHLRHSSEARASEGAAPETASNLKERATSACHRREASTPFRRRLAA